MAKELGTSNEVLKRTERSRQVILFANYGADPELSISREVVTTLADGTLVAKQDVAVVGKMLSEIADRKFRVGDLELSGKQIAAFIAQAGDDLREEEQKLAAEAAKATAEAYAKEAQEKAEALK